MGITRLVYYAAPIALTVSPAFAADHISYSPIYTTKDALALCKSISPDYCDGIFAGVTEASWGEQTKLKCAPVIYGPGSRISDSIADYVNKHPEYDTKPAYMTVRALALEACPQK